MIELLGDKDVGSILTSAEAGGCSDGVTTAGVVDEQAVNMTSPSKLLNGMLCIFFIWIT